MEELRGMPRVPSTSTRVAIPARLVGRVQDWATECGLAREEAVELLLSSSLEGPDSKAGQLRQAYESGAVQTPADLSATLDRAGVDVPVIGLVLGPRRPTAGDDPFERDHLGVDLDDDPLAVWPSVRGVWKIGDRVRVVVALRLGQPMGIYRVDAWEQVPGTGRKWATGAQVIWGDHRVDANTGLTLGAVTATDRTITDAVFACPLVLQASANPLVWLHRR